MTVRNLPPHIEEIVNQARTRNNVGRLSGEDNPGVKLSDAEVEELREKYATTDVSQQELADEYGISRTHTNRIIHFKVRKEAGGPTCGNPQKGEGNPRAKLSDEEVAELREDYRTLDITKKELGKKYGISETHAGRLADGKVRCD